MVRLTFVVGGGKGVRARYDDSMPVSEKEGGKEGGREGGRGEGRQKDSRVILK